VGAVKLLPDDVALFSEEEGEALIALGGAVAAENDTGGTCDIIESNSCPPYIARPPMHCDGFLMLCLLFILAYAYLGSLFNGSDMRVLSRRQQLLSHPV
jgi:hypothetical protein